MIYTTLLTPSVTTTLSEISTGFNEIFASFSPYAYFAITLILGFGGLAWIIAQIAHAVKH